MAGQHLTRRALLALLAPAPASAAGGRGAPEIARPPYAAVAFSRDGRTLAVAGYGGLQLLDAASRRETARLGGHPGAVNCLAYSPEGGLLAAGGGEPGRSGEIRLWNPRTRSVRLLAGLHKDAVYALAWSPDGRRLAAAGYDRLTSVWDVAAGTAQPLRDHTDAVYAIDWSPDGRWIATASGDRTVKLWDPDTLSRLYTLSEPTAELYAVAFVGPDSLAAGGADRMLRRWRVGPKSGELERSAFAHDGPVLCLAADRDGRRLFSGSADGSVKQWRPEDLTETAVIAREKEWCQGLSLSPTGDRLAACRHRGPVKVHSVGSALPTGAG